jgi:hypothetical protein
MSSHSSASLSSSVAGDSNYESFGSSSYTFGTLKNIFDSVYRCDSAAVVDSAYNCGSVTNQALYQGVEVIYNTSTTATAGTCSGSGGSNSGSNTNNNSSSPLQESWKSSVATKPLVVYQCFCDDDDFIDNESSPLSSADGRNPPPSLVEDCDDDDTRNSAATEEEEKKKKKSNVCPPKPVALKTHTKDFYSKIYSPTQRVITRLYDLKTPKTTTPNNNSKYNTTTSIIDHVSSSFSCLQESLSGSNHNHNHNHNDNDSDINIKITTITASSSATTITEQPLIHT